MCFQTIVFKLFSIAIMGLRNRKLLGQNRSQTVFFDMVTARNNKVKTDWRAKELHFPVAGQFLFCAV
jgi:hypothetical protein